MKIFKKYPNRRLYDVQEKRHVTQKYILDVVHSGEVVKVFDDKTDADITSEVLLKAFAEHPLAIKVATAERLHSYIRELPS